MLVALALLGKGTMVAQPVLLAGRMIRTAAVVALVLLAVMAGQAALGVTVAMVLPQRLPEHL